MKRVLRPLWFQISLIKKLNNQIKDIVKRTYVLKLLNNDIKKISVTSNDDYRSMTKKFSDHLDIPT